MCMGVCWEFRDAHSKKILGYFGMGSNNFKEFIGFKDWGAEEGDKNIPNRGKAHRIIPNQCQCFDIQQKVKPLEVHSRPAY